MTSTCVGPVGFSRESYTQLVQEFLSVGYRCVDLTELQADSQVLFLRHDVDFCAERALDLARVEKDMSVFSTYYFLVSTEFYNIASAEGRELLREMIGLGHRVALHFDTTKYSGDRAVLEAAANSECELLAKCSGAAVETISFHRPMPEFLNLQGHFAGRPHAYEPAYFKQVGYVADSGGSFRYGHPLLHEAFVNRRAMHLVTHPIWWTADATEDAFQKLERFRAEGERKFYNNIAGTVRWYGNPETAPK